MMVKAKTNTQTGAGFTIVELLIVIVVIGILAAITIVAYNGVQSRARDVKRIDDISKIVQGLQVWSVDTGKSLWEVTANGNTFATDGYFNKDYGSGSIQAILENGNYIPKGLADPGGRRYMIAICTTAISDNRRVAMAQLSNAPDQTVAQQLDGSGCANSHITSYSDPNIYGMNYAKVVNGS